MRDMPMSGDDAARDRRVFGLLAGLYATLILLPILRADRYFNDDLVRVLDGNFGWNHNGRPLTNLLMRALELGGQRLIDISPLPQLLAGTVLAWLGVLIARRFDLRSPWLAALVALPLGAQPFFLENLSYRFDAVCMALAIAFALWPVLTSRRGLTAGVLAVIALLASLCLYQPAITVFLVFAVLEAALAMSREAVPLRHIARTAGWRMLQLALAMLAYALLVEPSIEGWVREHSQVISLAQWPLLLDNAQRFASFIVSAFSPRWQALFAAITLLVFLLPSWMAWRHAAREASARNAASMALRARRVGEPLLWLLALPASIGPMLLLVEPVLMPRVLVGVGALIAALLIRLAVAARQQPRMQAWSIALAGSWALGMAVAAAAFGNAAGAQQRYEDGIAGRLLDDLAELSGTQTVRGHVLHGSAGLAPVVRHAQRHFPLLHWLVPSYLRADDYHARNYLRHHHAAMSAVPAEVALPDGALDAICGQPPVRWRQAYRIWLIDGVAVVRFSGEGAAPCPDADATGQLPAMLHPAAASVS